MASALILIDIQKGFTDPAWGARNNPQAEENAARLLAAWRTASAPVCHVRHLSTTQGSPLASAEGAEFMALVAPNDAEPVFEKSVNSGFIGTDLQDHLTRAGVREVVICGLTTPHCVSTTVRMAANLGFGVRLVHDACAAFAANASTDWSDTLPPLSPQVIHDTALSHLHGEFARVLTTDACLSEGP